MEGNVHAWNMFSTSKTQSQRKNFFTENCKIMPELFQILNYLMQILKFYVKKLKLKLQFFMKVMLKPRSGRTVLTYNEELLLGRSHHSSNIRSCEVTWTTWVLVTNWKNYFTRPMATELGGVVTFGRRSKTQTPKSSLTSYCILSITAQKYEVFH